MTTIEDISNRLSRLEESQQYLATKSDVEVLRGEIARLEHSQEYLATKADVEVLRGEMRTDREGIRVDLARMEGRLAWRLNGAFVAIGVSLVGLMGVLIIQQL